MNDEDSGGYAGVDHNAKYFRGMGRALALIAALVGILAAIPQTRDWLHQVLRKRSDIAADRRAADQANEQAVIRADIDNTLTTMRQCGDGAVVYGDEKCTDGSAGNMVMEQPAKR